MNDIVGVVVASLDAHVEIASVRQYIDYQRATQIGARE